MNACNYNTPRFLRFRCLGMSSRLNLSHLNNGCCPFLHATQLFVLLIMKILLAVCPLLAAGEFLSSSRLKLSVRTRLETQTAVLYCCARDIRAHSHSHSRDTLTSTLPHSRHVLSLQSYARKSIDKVNKENGELYFKSVNSNYNSNSL